MTDKYDEAIEWLVANPEELQNSWIHGGDGLNTENVGACLFYYCKPLRPHDPSKDCGCLTMVRGDGAVVLDCNQEIDLALTIEVREDERLPNDIFDIIDLRGDELRSTLQPFAFWQRRFDREIRGVVNV